MANGQIDSIKILKAMDLKDMDFACVIDNQFKVSSLLSIYNNATQTFEMRHQGQDYLVPKDINQIVYGNSKTDINLCDQQTSLRYKVVNGTNSTISDQERQYQLENREVPSQKLFVDFKLIDDMGTVGITYSREKTPAKDGTEGLLNITSTTKMHLDNYLVIQEDPFYFTVLDENRVPLYSGDATLFFDPENHYI